MVPNGKMKILVGIKPIKKWDVDQPKGLLSKRRTMVGLSSDLRKTWDAGNRIKSKELSRRIVKRHSQDGSYTGMRELYWNERAVN